MHVSETGFIRTQLREAHQPASGSDRSRECGCRDAGGRPEGIPGAADFLLTVDLCRRRRRYAVASGMRHHRPRQHAALFCTRLAETSAPIYNLGQETNVRKTGQPDGEGEKSNDSGKQSLRRQAITAGVKDRQKGGAIMLKVSAPPVGRSNHSLYSPLAGSGTVPACPQGERYSVPSPSCAKTCNLQRRPAGCCWCVPDMLTARVSVGPQAALVRLIGYAVPVAEDSAPANRIR